MRASSLSLLFFLLGWPGLGPAADLLFFASPKKSRQKKGEPKPGPLRGALRCSVRGGCAQTRFAQTVRASCPRAPALLSPVTRQVADSGADYSAGTQCLQPRTPQIWLCQSASVAPWGVTGRAAGPARGGSPTVAVMRWRVAQDWADQGWRCLSEASSARPRPDRATQRTRSFAAGSASGSPFFCLLFFGEAKKSEAPAGAKPGTPQSHCNFDIEQRPETK